MFIADLRDELRAGNETAVSEPLRSALEENLARGEQSILFLNRRGSSRMLLCGECGEVPGVPALQRSDDLSQCERTADVPLLRPQRTGL